ncbi:MAG: thiosulfate oxidation carrier complex protein SoxZ [Arcobacter sp.]|uniref:thiosulfate oxidation carrier complex protein SoxZ n=1 Tax=uncultured Arcobacter sp. TaxID=165434 RepID=UPI000CA6DC6C|nr:thiosulfate oxidation carrier complex protein SoxZ [uncultured Arcobacter sp.]PLY11339.1 MAG: thiosulfate oxidation carrier complex protein SoxZ [Arcobacter sp.]
MAKTRIKAKEKKGIVTVKAMAKHAMLSYQEAKRAKKEVNFITNIKVTSNGEVVYEVSTSQFLSKNPYVKFKFKGKSGDDLTFTWVDLKGKTQSDTVTIK